VRLNIHENRAAFDAYMEYLKPGEGWEDANGVCSIPPYADIADSKCYAEVNLYYPRIGPAIVSHELLHATFDYMGLIGAKNPVPTRSFCEWPHWSRLPKRKADLHNDMGLRQEIACYMLAYFMRQFHDECIKRNLWSR